MKTFNMQTVNIH